MKREAYPQRKITDLAVLHLKNYLGFSATPTLITRNGGNLKYWSIGYQHTGTVRPGMVLTPESAEGFLDHDIRMVERLMERSVIVPLNDHQFSALVCLAMDTGIVAFNDSTLLHLLNRGWYDQVATQIVKGVFPRDAKSTMSGETRRRRQAEAAMWKIVDDVAKSEAA